MLLNLERTDALVAQYVAGRLPEPAHVLVGSHLEMNAGGRRLALALEELAGESLEAMDPVPMAARDARIEAVLGSAPERLPAAAEIPRATQLPALLRAYAKADIADIPWKTKLPGFRQHVIEKSPAAEASLLWVRPGRALPRHRHRGLELTLVLQGEFRDHRGSFEEGAVSVADSDLDHRPVAGSRTPCICFSVLFAPIAFSGFGFRMLGDILGL